MFTAISGGVSGGNGGSGSPLNYSNSNASSGSGSTYIAGGSASQTNSNSRKSLISHPINFQHIQHMGPHDGKTYMQIDAPPVASLTTPTSATNGNGHGLPPLSTGTRIVPLSNLSMSEAAHTANLLITTPVSANASVVSIQAPNSKKQVSSSGIRQIAKNDISAPTNFRHVVKGLDDYAQQQQQPPLPKHTPSPPNSVHGSKNSTRIIAPADQMHAPPTHLPNITTAAANAANQQQTSTKSSSLSSSSSSSSSILHSPHSPTSSNNENLSQAISNTLKATSTGLYNGKLLDLNTNNVD